MRSRLSQHGVLEIDHSNSPGTLAVPEGHKAVWKTNTCSQCGCVVPENPARKRERYHCPRCDRFHCDTCVAVKRASGEDCKTLQQEFDEMQEKAYKGLIL